MSVKAEGFWGKLDHLLRKYISANVKAYANFNAQKHTLIYPQQELLSERHRIKLPQEKLKKIESQLNQKFAGKNQGIYGDIPVFRVRYRGRLIWAFEKQPEVNSGKVILIQGLSGQKKPVIFEEEQETPLEEIPALILDNYTALKDLVSHYQEVRKIKTARERLWHKLIEPSALPPRTKQIFNLRMGISDDHPRTFREIGRQLNRSDSRISEIEKKALRKINQRLSNP